MIKFRVCSNRYGILCFPYLSHSFGCRFVRRQTSYERKRREDDADLHLAKKIMRSRQYSLSGRVDDEYDFDDAPSRKRNRNREKTPEEKSSIPGRLLTQQERCQFCFENPSRPKHLIVSIGNFTYLMLPQWQPVVQGHCCILPVQVRYFPIWNMLCIF